MQWKMAQRSRRVERLHEWAMRRGFPILAKIAPRLPRWFLHLGARFVITLVMAFYSSPKPEIDRNLRRILGATVGGEDGGELGPIHSAERGGRPAPLEGDAAGRSEEESSVPLDGFSASDPSAGRREGAAVGGEDGGELRPIHSAERGGRPAPLEKEARRLRRRMIRHLAYYWVDLFRFSQLPYERTRLLLSEVVGLQHLERAAAAGRGVVLLTAHLGNWELGSVFLREQNLPLSVVYVRDQSPSAEAFRGFLRGCLEVEEIALDPRGQLSSLPVLRALQAGRVVAMQGDRDLNDRGDWFPFFGRPAPFPTGPMEVARLTGAQLVPVFVVYDEDYRFRLEFGEPIEVSGTGDRRQEVRRAQGRWVELLERAVARWPDQWYTFFDFWRQRERGLPVPVAAPDDRSEVERQTGARPNDDSREEAPRKETLRKEAM